MPTTCSLPRTPPAISTAARSPVDTHKYQCHSHPPSGRSCFAPGSWWQHSPPCHPFPVLLPASPRPEQRIHGLGLPSCGAAQKHCSSCQYSSPLWKHRSPEHALGPVDISSFPSVASWERLEKMHRWVAEAGCAELCSLCSLDQHSPTWCWLA